MNQTGYEIYLLMGPISAFKRVCVAAFAVASVLTIATGNVEVAAWYFVSMISGGVVATSLYCIYIIAGLPDELPITPVVAVPSEVTVPSPVPEELIHLVTRSEYRDMIREFVGGHSRGACCGGLSKEEICLLVNNIQHTQVSLTAVSYEKIEEFVAHHRVEAIFSASNDAIRLLMCLAVAISGHRVDNTHCDMASISSLCAEIRRNPLLRDIYGGDDPLFDTRFGGEEIVYSDVSVGSA